MIQRIKAKVAVLRADSHMREVMHGATLALAIRIFGALLGFAVSVTIARMLGAKGSGVYYLSLSVTTIAATVGQVGFDNTVVRFIASYASAQDWNAVRFIYRTSMKIVATASLLVSVLLFLSAGWIANVFFDKPYMELPLRLVSLSVLPLSLAMIQAESLRGLKKIAASQLISIVLVPLVTLVLIYPLAHFGGANGAVTAYVIAIFVTALVSWLLWRKIGGNKIGISGNNLHCIPIKQLLKSSWPLYGVALTGLVLMQAATLFLGVWGNAEDIGIFNVANRVASLLLFPLMALISILAPKFSAMYHQGDMPALKRLAISSSRALTFFAVPVGVMVALFAEQILSIFGQGFSGGANVLVILLIGVVINAVTGPVGNLLMMTGKEQVVRNTTVVGGIITIALLFLLVPLFSSMGAAMAISFGMVMQNILMTWQVTKLLGFNPIRFT